MATPNRLLKKTTYYSETKDTLTNNDTINQSLYLKVFKNIRQDISTRCKQLQESILEVAGLLLRQPAEGVILKELVEVAQDLNYLLAFRQLAENCMKKSLFTHNFQVVNLFALWSNGNRTKLLEIAQDWWSKLESTTQRTRVLEDFIPFLFLEETNCERRRFLVDFLAGLTPKVNVFLLDDAQCDEFIRQLPNLYIKFVEKLREAHKPSWSSLWIFLVRFCDRKLHDFMHITNQLLRIVESAFRNTDHDERLVGYDCWMALIENTSLDMNRLCSPKQLKLILTPLKAKFSRQDVVILKRFDVFLFLLKKLSNKGSLCLNEVLEFCFGPIPDSPTSPAKPGQGSAVKTLWPKSIALLMDLLDATNESETKEENIKLILNKMNFLDFESIIFHATREAIKMDLELNTNSESVSKSELILRALLCLILQQDPKTIPNLLDSLQKIHICKQRDDGIVCPLLARYFCSAFITLSSSQILQGIDYVSKVVFSNLCSGDFIHRESSFELFVNTICKASKDNKRLAQELIKFFKKASCRIANLTEIWKAFGNSIAIQSLDEEDASCFMVWPVVLMDDKFQTILKDWLEHYKIIKNEAKMRILTELGMKFKKELLVRSNICEFLDVLLQSGVLDSNELFDRFLVTLSDMTGCNDLWPKIKQNLTNCTISCLFSSQGTSETNLKSLELCIENLIELQKIDFCGQVRDKALAKSEHDKSMVFDQLSASKKDFLKKYLKGWPVLESIDNKLPVKTGSLSANSRTAKISKLANSSPSSKFGSPKTPKFLPPEEPKSSDFVPINTQVKLDVNKLNEHQKEVLLKRREDIPALYEDLTQSQDSQAFNKTLDSVKKIVDENPKVTVERIEDPSSLRQSPVSMKPLEPVNLIDKIVTHSINEQTRKKVQSQLKLIQMDIVGAEQFFPNNPAKRTRRGNLLKELVQKEVVKNQKEVIVKNQNRRKSLPSTPVLGTAPPKKRGRKKKSDILAAAAAAAAAANQITSPDTEDIIESSQETFTEPHSPHTPLSRKNKSNLFEETTKMVESKKDVKEPKPFKEPETPVTKITSSELMIEVINEAIKFSEESLTLDSSQEAETQTQTQTQTQNSESNSITNLTPDIKYDLPVKPILTKSESEFAAWDTISILSDNTMMESQSEVAKTVVAEKMSEEIDFGEVNSEELVTKVIRKEEELSMVLSGKEDTSLINKEEESSIVLSGDKILTSESEEEIAKKLSPQKDEEDSSIKLSGDKVETILTPKKSLPASPISGDTPSRTDQLLDSTFDISPITSQSEPEIAEPEEPKAQNAKPCHERSSRLLQMINIDLPATRRTLTPKATSLTSSPSANRIKRLMSSFNQRKKDLEPQQILEEDLLTFQREIPSPLALPKISILKRKYSETSEGSPSPLAKRKRVNFSDPPLTSKKLYIKDNPQSFLEGRSLFGLEEKVDKETTTSPIYPKLICSEEDLTKLNIKTDLTKLEQVKTIGHLAGLTRDDLLIVFEPNEIEEVQKSMEEYFILSQKEQKIDDGSVDDVFNELETMLSGIDAEVTTALDGLQETCVDEEEVLEMDEQLARPLHDHEYFDTEGPKEDSDSTLSKESDHTTLEEVSITTNSQTVESSLKFLEDHQELDEDTQAKVLTTMKTIVLNILKSKPSLYVEFMLSMLQESSQSLIQEQEEADSKLLEVAKFAFGKLSLAEQIQLFSQGISEAIERRE